MPKTIRKRNHNRMNPVFRGMANIEELADMGHERFIKKPSSVGEDIFIGILAEVRLIADFIWGPDGARRMKTEKARRKLEDTKERTRVLQERHKELKRETKRVERLLNSSKKQMDYLKEENA